MKTIMNQPMRLGIAVVVVVVAALIGYLQRLPFMLGVPVIKESDMDPALIDHANGRLGSPS